MLEHTPTETASTEELAHYIDRLPIGIFRSTRDGRLVMANTALLDILGYESMDELLAINTRDLYVDPTQRDEAIAHGDRFVDFPVQHFDLKRKDGTVFSARVHVRADHGSDSRTQYFEGVLEDLTEIRAVEHELALSESRFRSAFEKSPIPMILFDPYMMKRDLNESATRLLGITREEYHESQPGTFMTDEGWADAQERMASMRSGEIEGYSAVRKIPLPSGEHRWAVVSVNAVRNDDGTLHSAITQIVDITEQREANRALEALLESKDELVRSVSHELRTPLTSIVGLADQMVAHWDEFDDAEKLELTRMIAEQGSDMTALVDDLLAAARPEELSIEIQPVDLVEEVGLVVKPWHGQMTLDLIYPETPVRARTDPKRLRQILRNLLTNAAKYGVAPVTIEISSRPGFATVAVRDQGKSLPAEMHERIFERYFRVRSDEDTESIGLGLAVSRELARQMGGDLVYRDSGGHSQFLLSMPAAG